MRPKRQKIDTPLGDAMKGIMFNLVQEVVEEEFGAETWDALLDATGLDGAYTSLGNYDDAQMLALVGAAANALKMEADDVLRMVGRKAIHGLQSRYPDLFEQFDSTRGMVSALDHVIHVEVHKMYEGSITPTFEVMDADVGFDVIYRSTRMLPALAAGLMEGAGDHYQDPVAVAMKGEQDGGILLEVRPA